MATQKLSTVVTQAHKGAGKENRGKRTEGEEQRKPQVFEGFLRQTLGVRMVC